MELSDGPIKLVRRPAASSFILRRLRDARDETKLNWNYRIWLFVKKGSVAVRSSQGCCFVVVQVLFFVRLKTTGSVVLRSSQFCFVGFVCVLAQKMHFVHFQTRYFKKM